MSAADAAARARATLPAAPPLAVSAARVSGAGKPLAPPTWTGTSGVARAHALIGLGLAAGFAVEGGGNFAYPVYRGPTEVLSALPAAPLHVWAVLIAVPAVMVLVRWGAPRCRGWLTALVAVYGAFGLPALAVGIARPDAATTLGEVCLGHALLAALTVVGLARRWD